MKKARRPAGFWAGKPCPDYNDPAYSHLPWDEFFQEYQALEHGAETKAWKGRRRAPAPAAEDPVNLNVCVGRRRARRAPRRRRSSPRAARGEARIAQSKRRAEETSKARAAQTTEPLPPPPPPLPPPAQPLPPSAPKLLPQRPSTLQPPPTPTPGSEAEGPPEFVRLYLPGLARRLTGEGEGPSEEERALRAEFQALPREIKIIHTRSEMWCAPCSGECVYEGI